MIVFDTDIVTLLSHGQTPKLRERMGALDENEELAVTVITYAEIIRPRCENVSKAANGEEMAKAIALFRASKSLLDDFLILYPSDESHRRFEALMNAKKGRTRKKDRSDMMIASIALANDALLVTRNVGDYRGIAGLRVENWAD
jgi:predicted nucleic acid-binding protein